MNFEEKYKKLDKLGEGGNGEVIKVRSLENNLLFALKELKNKKDKEKKKRFIQEIEIMNKIRVHTGVMPILDYDKEDYWFIMPIATPIDEHILDKNLFEIINGLVQLCEILIQLRDRKNKIYHRDIKPENIFYYEERFVLSDFGLSYEEGISNNNTRNNRPLGARFTIAPEMKRNPAEANPGPADVYSLAKTMWILITGTSLGFEGQYNTNDSLHSIRSIVKYRKSYLPEIEELLRLSTSNDPSLRPSMQEYRDTLVKWIKNHSNENSQLNDWDYLSNRVFGNYIPSSAVWSDKGAMVQILNNLSNTHAYNHMFLPGGGGLDFEYAESSSEQNCIKIYDTNKITAVLKPKKLYFERFESNTEWNYFILEFEGLSPINSEKVFEYEQLIEDRPGNYVASDGWNYGVYNYDSGEKLPKEAQLVTRYVKSGNFLFVMKSGPYNYIKETYDGRHSMVSASQFKEYYKTLVAMYEEYKDLFNKESHDKNLTKNILNLPAFTINPFQSTQTSPPTIDNSYLKEEEIYRIIKDRHYELTFDVTNYLNKYDKKSPILFYIHFNSNFNGSFSMRDLFNEEYDLLSKNGKVLEKCQDNQVLYLSSRDNIFKLKDELCRQLIKKLDTNEVERPLRSAFQIKFKQNNKPSHLFTKEEIEKEMSTADDRVHNVLVVNENGYVHIISPDEKRLTYPVINEIWNAGNNYVGKYSDLNTLNDTYLVSLQMWLLYLENGKRTTLDYPLDNRDINDLIRQIKKFY